MLSYIQAFPPRIVGIFQHFIPPETDIIHDDEWFSLHFIIFHTCHSMTLTSFLSLTEHWTQNASPPNGREKGEIFAFNRAAHSEILFFPADCKGPRFWFALAGESHEYGVRLRCCLTVDLETDQPSARVQIYWLPSFVCIDPSTPKPKTRTR